MTRTKPRYGSPPTERELNALALALLHGQKTAAHMLGIQPQTLKSIILSLSARLGVSGAHEAAERLGWFDSIPQRLRQALSGPMRPPGRAPRS